MCALLCFQDPCFLLYNLIGFLAWLVASHRRAGYFRSRLELACESTPVGLVGRHRGRLNDWGRRAYDWFL